MVRLEGALSNLIQLKMSLLIARGLDDVAFEGAFQPKPFYDSMIAASATVGLLTILGYCQIFSSLNSQKCLLQSGWQLRWSYACSSGGVCLVSF